MATLEEALGAPMMEFMKIWLIPQRFIKLAFARRMIAEQLEHNLRVSKHEFKKNLGWLSFAAMGVGIIVATGIFSFMPFVYSNITGPAVILSLLVASGVSALSAIIYSEFAVEYPVAGGGFVYVLNTFGELPAILCAVNLVIDYLFGCAAVARNFSVYVMQLFNRDDNPFQKNVSFQSDDIDYMALILIVFLTIVIILSTKAFDEGNTFIQVLHVGLVVLTFVIAFTKARKSYWTPFFPKTCSADGLSCPDDGSLLPKEDSCVDSSFGPRGARRIITGASNLFFVFIGYDVIALGAEEAKSPYSVPIGMLGAVALVTIIYVLMASSLVMLYPFVGLACQPENVQIAAFAYAFEQRGLKWAKYIVAAGAAIGVFTSTGISLYGLSRVFQVFAREGVMPPIVGRVNSFTNTPIIAIALSGIACGLMAFFTSFATLANMTSIGTLVMFWFVALAHLYRRYAPELEEEKAHQNRHLSIPFRPDPFRGLSVTLRRAILLTYLFFITAFPVGFAIYWNRSEGSSLLIVMTILWFVTSLLLQLTMPIQYVPEKFSIPWYTMPWTSSVAIFAIIVIIGGFGANKSDYYRLFSAMGIGTVVYLLYSLPANSWRFHESDKTTLTEQELAFRDEGK